MGEKYDYLDYRENEAKLEQLRNRDMNHFSQYLDKPTQFAAQPGSVNLNSQPERIESGLDRSDEMTQ